MERIPLPFGNVRQNPHKQGKQSILEIRRSINHNPIADVFNFIRNGSFPACRRHTLSETFRPKAVISAIAELTQYLTKEHLGQLMDGLVLSRETLRHFLQVNLTRVS